MNRTIFRLIVAFPLVLSSGAVLAGQPVDNYGTAALVSAQYDAVVAKLEPIALNQTKDESLLLNLAMAYRHTGRNAEAEALYRRVLALDNAELETSDGATIMSHVIARRGLAQRRMLLSSR